MSQLICPFCGQREPGEFEFRKTLPAQAGPGVAAVYLRVERAGLSLEHWQHVHGCRAWLLVSRNPLTGAVLSTVLLPAESS